MYFVGEWKEGAHEMCPKLGIKEKSTISSFTFWLVKSFVVFIHFQTSHTLSWKKSYSGHTNLKRGIRGWCTVSSIKIRTFIEEWWLIQEWLIREPSDQKGNLYGHDWKLQSIFSLLTWRNKFHPAHLHLLKTTSPFSPSEYLLFAAQ